MAMRQQLESTYNIKITRDGKSAFPNEWKKKPINAQLIKIDEREFHWFPALLTAALQRYPKKVATDNLKGIVLAKEIIFYGVGFGATNSKDFVFICSEGKDKGYTDDYLIGSFHHEFSSILFRNYEFPKKRWISCNPNGFNYTKIIDESGSGGVQAIKDGKDGLKGNVKLYKIGFLAEYSLTELEEDFNMYSELILTSPKQFKGLMNNHLAIREKFKVWLNFYRKIDKSITEQWLFDRK